jgi:hypothetical protein
MDGTKSFGIEVLRRPTLLVPLPMWPEPKRAIELAIAGAKEDPQLAIGFDFWDTSSICLVYMTMEDEDTPLEVYQQCGGLPLLKVQLFDRGVPRPHEAEKAWKGIEALMGRKPLSIIGAAIDQRNSRRAYWWHVEG